MILHTLNRFRDGGLLLLRLGLGLSYMIVHGKGKLFGGPERWAQVGENAAAVGLDFLPTFWGFMGGLAEFAGGLLLILGLLFRPALFFLICTMAVAATAHATGAIGGSPWHAAELGVVFLALFFIGPGRYSLDERLYQRKRSPY